MNGDDLHRRRLSFQILGALIIPVLFFSLSMMGRTATTERPMADSTPNLQLPYILPSQAQKHVMHNEALVMLDRLVQLALEYEGDVAPGAPQEGERFAVGGSPTGPWSGRAGTIACFQDGGWLFAAPRTGYMAFFKDSGTLKIFTGSGWERPPLPDVLTPSRLGISATPDETNRLAVSSPATLLNHAGGGHQLKINKATAGDTASLLFQSNWSGRAEMGLSGDDAFSIKVSGDGSAWATALHCDGEGRVSMPNRPLARAHRASGTSTPASGSETGFTDLALEQGGFSLGLALSGGGNALSVPSDGLFLVALMVTVTASSGFSVSLRRNGFATLLAVQGPGFAPATASGVAIVQLYAGDELSLLHAGSATIDEGAGRTQLSLTRL
jgi:Protein of unknown function (DUF2793)